MPKKPPKTETLLTVSEWAKCCLMYRRGWHLSRIKRQSRKLHGMSYRNLERYFTYFGIRRAKSKPKVHKPKQLDLFN